MTTCPLKRTRLRPTSAKRKDQNGRRRALGWDGMPCEVRDQLAAALEKSGRLFAAQDVIVRCGHHAENWHERRKSGAGGSRENPDNLVGACQQCNGAVEMYPIEARTAGLCIREGDVPPAEWEALGARADRFTQETDA